MRWYGILPFCVLAFLAAFLPAVDTSGRSPIGHSGGGGSTPPFLISSITFGAPYQVNATGYPSNYVAGDIWQFTWGSDGSLYTKCDDCFGWEYSVAPQGRGIFFSKVNTYTTAMVGTNINTLDAFSVHYDTNGSDGRNPKGFGTISVHGTIYMMTTRQLDAGSAPFKYAESGGQITASSNLGVTFSPQPPSVNNPFTSPMWPGAFGPLWFVQYDKQDYTGQTADQSDAYVYATNTMQSFYNNNDDLIIGRVLISQIADLNAAEWQWRQSDGSWGAYNTAGSILHSPGQISATGVQYVPFCQCYVMINWYYPTITPSLDGSTTIWQAYSALHPWGPWTLVDTHTWNPGGYYAPNPIPSSVIGNTMMLVTTGNFQIGDELSNPTTTPYQPTLIPVVMQGPGCVALQTDYSIGCNAVAFPVLR